jgi:phospholipase/carboxylesterase
MIRLDGPRVPPRGGGKPKQLVILAHGYGSNGDDLIGLAPYFARALPDATFVSPNAPDPVPGYPGGHQWFPISGIEPRLMAQGARSAAPSLDRFIDQELQRYGLPASACALVGFSQGTMMSLHVGLRRPEALAAILGYSGMLPVAEPAEVKSRPPIALVHGDRDEVIPIQALFAALDGLGACGAPVLFRISAGLPHSIGQDGLDLGAAFLRDAFRGKFSGWAAPVRRAAGA